MFGEAGNDTVNGNGGDDTLSGGDGNDALDGGAGTNSVDAGLGNNKSHHRTRLPLTGRPKNRRREHSGVSSP